MVPAQVVEQRHLAPVLGGKPVGDGQKRGRQPDWIDHDEQRHQSGNGELDRHGTGVAEEGYFNFVFQPLLADIISGAIDTHRVHAYFYRGYWADGFISLWVLVKYRFFA